MVSGDVCVDMSGRLLAGSVGTGGTVGVLGAVDGSEHDGAGGNSRLEPGAAERRSSARSQTRMPVALCCSTPIWTGMTRAKRICAETYN